MLTSSATWKSLFIFALLVMVIAAASCNEETPPPETPIVNGTPTRIPPGPPAPTATITVPPTPEVGVPETATSEPPKPPESKVTYSVGIFEDPETINFWDYYAGPSSSVWTGYVLEGLSTSLYSQSHKRFDWVPLVADGFPTALKMEEVNGQGYWTSEVNLKKGLTWSDGVEITADDFVFVVDTILDLHLGGNASVNVNDEFVANVEALDSHKIKVYFYADDEHGEPIVPGLSVWQFGLAFTPMLAKHYWEPIIKEAMNAGDHDERANALFSHDPINEPSAGGFSVSQWSPDAFVRLDRDENWFRSGTRIRQFQNGAYQEIAPGGDQVTYYGDPSGPVALDMEVGPHFDTTLFNVYSSQDAAVLALINGDIDYMFNPLGLSKGFQDQIRSTPDLNIITNPANSVRYLGFNFRKEPMNNAAFRKAVAVMTDKEFVTDTILQGSAAPAYSMVPAGNGFWHNSGVSMLGKGMSTEERLSEAVSILKDAGFTFEQEPVMSHDGDYVEQQGKGLRMPDGTLVPELEIVAPSDGYDPLRATFAIRIERWMNDLGVPTRARLTGFDNILDMLFDDPESVDMWILGWSLTLFPDYLNLYFHTESEHDGFNFGGYSNAAFDALGDELFEATDVEAARDIVIDMQAVLASDLPYVTLFSPQSVDVYRPSKVRFPYTDTVGGIQFSNGLLTVVEIE